MRQFGKSKASTLLLLFGLGGASLAQEAPKSGFAVRQCKCFCGSETMQLDFAEAQACEQNTGSVCEQASGTRAKLTECSLLFVNPRAAQASVAMSPSAPPAVAAPTPVAAQSAALGPTTICRDSETWQNCSDRMQGSLQPRVDDKMAEMQEGLQENLQDLLLGAAEVSGAATHEDFLRRFLLGLDLPGLSDENGLLSFHYNTPGGALGFEASANKPVFFEKLKETIPEADRAAKVAELEKNLDEFDDISYSLKINIRPPDSKLRRDLKTYTEPAELLLEQAAADVKGSFGKILGIRMAEPVEQAGAQRSDFENLLQTQSAAFLVGSSFEQRLKELGFYSLADLAANQPQFFFQLSGRERDDLIGPDKVEASLVWEVGLGANLNMLQQRLAESRCQDDQAVGCIQAFLVGADDAVERKWRLSFKAAYSETEAYDSPIEGVTFHLDKAKSVIASAAWGGVLSYMKAPDGKTVELSSFALDASYEDVTGDKERQNRFVATATFTQHLTDDMSFQLTGVWANKPEYRGEVDKELGARAGIRYKFNRPPATTDSGKAGN